MTIGQMDLLLSDLSSGYYIRQVLAILFLFLIGTLFLYAIREHMRPIWLYLLAFPMGLALWCIAGFLLLAIGIRFSLLTELLVIAVIMLVFWFLTWYRHRFLEQTDHIRKPFHMTGIVLVIMLIIACIAVSGVISISISNDTMYYYMYYPEVLAKEGAYLRGYDVFLSDVGPMAAIIGTIPALLGFDQFYGIQQMYLINFLLIFSLFVYERAQEKLQHKTSIWVTVAAALLLMTATPFVVLSKWILANMYVMGYSFILFALAFKVAEKRTENTEDQRDYMIVFMVLSAMISMLRMEGGMLMCFMIVCISTLRFENRELIMRFLLPASVMPCIYYVRYFLFLKVSPVYSFLTWQKAVVAIGVMVLLGHYLGGIRGKHLLRLQKHTGWLILTGLVMVNAALFVIAPSDYIVVLRAFCQNFVYQQGWGYILYLLMACYIALFFAGNIRHKEICYENLVFLGYMFYTLAVSFARGGGLRRDVADSGNRVMLQVIPFMIFALVCTAIEFLKEKDSSDVNDH